MQQVHFAGGVCQVGIACRYAKAGDDRIPIQIDVIDKELSAGCVLRMERQAEQTLLDTEAGDSIPDIQEWCSKQLSVL